MKNSIRASRPRLTVTITLVLVAAVLAIQRSSGSSPVFGAWTELGPRPFYGVKPPVSDVVVHEPMSGQPAGIAVDLAADPTGNTVYLCASGGGLWKSTNGLGVSPAFVLLSNPALPSSCGAVALDPSTNPTTIYVGTGDPDNPSNINSYAGRGILISRDGGQSWTQVGSADNGDHPFHGMGFSRILVNPGNPNVLVAATGVGSDGNFAHSVFPQGNTAFNHLGIYRSTNAGTTWSLVRSTPINGNNLNGFFHVDLVHEPVRDLYVAGISNEGLFASTDGTSWQPLEALGVPTGGLPAASDMHRVSLATRGGTLWAFVIVIPYPARTDPCDPASECEVYKAHRLFELAPNAASWREIPKPAALAHKGFLAYVAAPPNSNGLVVAAEHLFRTDDITIQNPAWKHIEYGSTASLHGDQHAIGFADADKWYVGDDGGLFATLNRGDDWRSLNATLRTTEFYSATADAADSGSYAGGQQDNGQALKVIGDGWFQVLLGDGTYAYPDPFDEQAFFTSTQFGSLWYQRTVFPAVPERVVDFADANDTNVSGGRGAFLTPFEVLPADPRLYDGVTAPPGFDFGQARILLTGNTNPWLVGFVPSMPPFAIRQLHGLAGINNRYIQYIASDPQDATTAYIVTGHESPALYRLGNIGFAGTATKSKIDVPTGALGSGSVLGHVAVSPVCSEGLYIAKVGFVRDQKILKSTDGGGSWINISGNLPNVPVHWMLPDPANPDVLYVGTNVGAFVATDGGVEGEQWQRLGTDLPDVPVMQLAISPARTLVAATFGRGVWTLPLPSLAPYTPQPPDIDGLSVSHGQLAPPDHRMVEVTVDYTAKDDCGTPACTISATSSEPANGLGDGDTDIDIDVLDNRQVRLRAERSALGPGRTYAITVTCTGSDGLSTSASTTVLVPKAL